jgi:5-formyltetrahydrofolate cyclo-ligase
MDLNMETKDVKKLKNEIRRKIWDLLEEKDVAAFPRPVHGRIPNFKGADVAAQRITGLPEWQKASVVKSNPDSPQYHLRLQALREGKILVMATPRLIHGFLVLNPRLIPTSRLSQAATIAGAFKYGRLISLREMPNIDLIVTGCVAVDRRGARLGKGGGYSELEYGILKELGVVDEKTPIVTTIHDLQVVSEEIPMEVHDYTVDYYATPRRLVKIDGGFRYRPRGIYWDLLKPELRELRVIKELIEIKHRGL